MYKYERQYRIKWWHESVGSMPGQRHFGIDPTQLEFFNPDGNRVFVKDVVPYDTIVTAVEKITWYRSGELWKVFISLGDQALFARIKPKYLSTNTQLVKVGDIVKTRKTRVGFTEQPMTINNYLLRSYRSNFSQRMFTVVDIKHGQAMFHDGSWAPAGFFRVPAQLGAEK